jgi:hypothetical protein
MLPHSAVHVLPHRVAWRRAASLPCEADLFDLHAIDDVFRQILVSLLNGEPIECHVKHTIFESISPPTAAIVDVRYVQCSVASVLL